MRRVDTTLPGVFVVEPAIHGDRRGFFLETYRADRFAEFGIAHAFVQANHSRSAGGVLRGLHYQLGQPQAKLVRVVAGAVFDVAVDVRRGSPSFGRWFGVELSADNGRQLYVPVGFAHGFLVLSESADVVYQCSDYYAPPEERGIAWNDPGIGVAWPLRGEPVLSAKDARNPILASYGAADLPPFPASDRAS